jgi:signal transduction histidine kinase
MLVATAPALAAAPKSVLILSEGPVLPYGLALIKNIIETVRRDSPEPLNIYEELIDRIRFDSAEYDRQLVALYKSKYVGTAAPTLIITITEPALDFALRHQDELFPNAAILFGAVDERAVGRHTLNANVTGVFQVIDAQATVEAALRLHPRTRRVVVVSGASRLDRGYLDVVREGLSGLGSQTAVTYLTGKPLNEVLAAVASLGDDAMVLFVSMQSDGDGVARTGPEVVAALRGRAAVPIYGMSDNFLGRGIVGGMVFDIDTHGTDLARRGKAILSGVTAADLVPMRSANRLSFDWRELRRFDIDEALLPAGATVVNREPGTWNAYRRELLVTGVVFLGQSLLIGTLLVQRRRRRAAEIALRELSGRLLSAQEDERHRIARELHDNLSQQMALLAIGITQLSKKLVDTPELVRSLHELGRRTIEISSEIHNLSHRLHSSKLTALGLVEALRGHCAELMAQGIHAHFHDERVPPQLPHDVALCLFRIVQEALNNVVKHSGAHKAEVTLKATGSELTVTIADFGHGFNPKAATRTGGVGLASMRERLRLLGGEFTLRSQPGQGTTIVARVPIAATADTPLADTVQVA